MAKISAVFIRVEGPPENGGNGDNEGTDEEIDDDKDDNDDDKDDDDDVKSNGIQGRRSWSRETRW